LGSQFLFKYPSSGIIFLNLKSKINI